MGEERRHTHKKKKGKETQNERETERRRLFETEWKRDRQTAVVEIKHALASKLVVEVDVAKKNGSGEEQGMVRTGPATH